MKSPRFAIENVLLHLSEHFTYLNSGEDKGVRIIEGLLYMPTPLIKIASPKLPPWREKGGGEGRGGEVCNEAID